MIKVKPKQKSYNIVMDNAQQQLVEKIKTSNNVLVTVSRNPSVDQLSSLIGISLLLNKQGKHCAAVFSGKIPSTLEFLSPEDTIEKTTDSLRDFIIALDKSKADKLRYKVEDNIVRIFITPYRTSISQDDLDFSQGDFNVDLVIALGVTKQEDLDEAITAHGRILHDAVVASINVLGEANLGSINWYNPGASSLSELVANLAQVLDKNLMDQQVATALLTGIVAETNRFSNDKTSSQTMTASAILMAAGANQQLVASQLEQPVAERSDPIGSTTDGSSNSEATDQTSESKTDDGTLEIEHSSQPDIQLPAKLPSEVESPVEDNPTQPMELPEPEIGEVKDVTETNVSPEIGEQRPSAGLSGGPTIMTEPPTLGGTLTASATQNYLDPTTDPMTLANNAQPQPILERTQTPAPADRTPSLNEVLAEVDSQDPEAFQSQSIPTAVESPITTPEASQYTLVSPEANTSNDVYSPVEPLPTPVNSYTPPPLSWTPPPAPMPSVNEEAAFEPIPTPEPQQFIDNNETLSQLEEAVHSPHLSQQAPAAESARQEVDNALNAAPAGAQPPIEALNAQPLGPSLHSDFVPTSNASSAPPPVPPPIPFEFGKPPNS
jgi:hypothetical protein